MKPWCSIPGVTKMIRVAYKEASEVVRKTERKPGERRENPIEKKWNVKSQAVDVRRRWRNLEKSWSGKGREHLGAIDGFFRLIWGPEAVRLGGIFRLGGSSSGKRPCADGGWDRPERRGTHSGISPASACGRAVVLSACTTSRVKVIYCAPLYLLHGTRQIGWTCERVVVGTAVLSGLLPMLLLVTLANANATGNANAAANAAANAHPSAAK